MNIRKYLPLITLLGVASLSAPSLKAETIASQYGGTWNAWPTVWTAISSLNEGTDTGVASYLDFVGNTASPLASYALTSNYICFRLQVDANAYSSSWVGSTFMILVNAVGYNNPLNLTNQNAAPDFSFAWDNNVAAQNHGLEMQIPSTLGNTFKDLRMADLDGNSGQKITNMTTVTPTLANDFRLTGGDGYIQTVSGHDAGTLGTTTYIEIAISRAYLTANVPALAANSSWQIQLGTIPNANDHNAITGDVAGGLTPDSTIISTAWSDPINVPEPSTNALLFLAGGMALVALRQRSKPIACQQ